MKLPLASFWRGKRVLLTGHSGFKGSWLTLWLRQLGAQIVGISLVPNTRPNLFTLAGIEQACESHFCDIRDSRQLAELVRVSRPEIIFHLAAQPLVRASYRAPLETFGTNIMGTAHLLDALRGLDCVKVAVMITTDKVYHNTGQHRPFSEEDRLGGHDPYSASKAASEVVIDSYRDAFLAAQGVAVVAARAGNVIGGGDWSEDRLIPDAIRAWQAKRVLAIRHPQAVRPWQHVLDPLAAYLTLAETLWESPMLSGAYNFGPDQESARSVADVVELARASFGSGEVEYSPSGEGLHEAALLSLDNEKARAVLGVTPHWQLPIAVEKTIQWYRAQRGGSTARELCLADIAAFGLQA